MSRRTELLLLHKLQLIPRRLVTLDHEPSASDVVAVCGVGRAGTTEQD